MSRTTLAVAWTAVLLVAFAGAAHARNPNCAGGIQYLSQAMKDKNRGNMEDYDREISKAVQRLEMCSVEDPKDFEAIGYLGWAYAEVDSACAAGEAFTRAIAGLKEKGDKKKVQWAETNRESYWATAFNEGIQKINDAQKLYPDFNKKLEPGEETLKEEAKKNYFMAIDRLEKAECLKHGDPRTLRNLGTAHAFMGDYTTAEKILSAAVEGAPNDSDLVSTLKSVQSSAAAKLVQDEKYDEAIAYYEGLVPNDDEGALWMGLADAYFKRAQTHGSEGRDARTADFAKAGKAFANAGKRRPNDADLPFNAALAFQNAGDYESAEIQWRAALKSRPEDPDALSALGATLAELKKNDEAISKVHQAVMLDPKNKSRHRQLGAVYTKAGNNPKATEELMVYLALQNGKPVDDVQGQVAKAKGDAAKLLKQSGPPEEVWLWEADGESYESWFYWSRGFAQHFRGGTMVQRSDWSTADTKSAGN